MSFLRTTQAASASRRYAVFTSVARGFSPAIAGLKCL